MEQHEDDHRDQQQDDDGLAEAADDVAGHVSSCRARAARASLRGPPAPDPHFENDQSSGVSERIGLCTTPLSEFLIIDS